MRRMNAVRKAIIASYAEWTVMSALRSGAPIKSRRDVYTALRGVDLDVLFADDLGPINRTTFDAWHANGTTKIGMRREATGNSPEVRVPIVQAVQP